MSPFITTLITLSAFLILLLCSLNAIKTIRRQEKNNQKHKAGYPTRPWAKGPANLIVLVAFYSQYLLETDKNRSEL